MAPDPQLRRCDEDGVAPVPALRAVPIGRILELTDQRLAAPKGAILPAASAVLGATVAVKIDDLVELLAAYRVQDDVKRAKALVRFLNDLLDLDRAAIGDLVNSRVPCNQALAVHPTVQVGVSNGAFVVGLLGLLNGFCPPPNPDQGGYLVAHFDDDGVLQRFGLSRGGVIE